MYKVSIISMVKNESKYISSAIDSIMSQDGVEVELIVVDDYSTDNTYEILKKISNVNPRVKVFKNPETGKVAAFRYGCSKATGDYYAFFAGDDIMPAGSLLKRLEAIQNVASPSVVVSKIQVMSDDRKIDGMQIPKAPGKGNPSGASIMIDKAAARYFLDIPKSLPNEDTWMDLCIRFIDEINVVHQDDVACFWRVHAGNSITVRQGFRDFNDKFTARMDALQLFYNKYSEELTQANKNLLEKLIDCESKRRLGLWIKLIYARVPLGDKLRFLFYTNSFFFSIRRVIRNL